MVEETMVCIAADCVNNDHGYASLAVELKGNSGHQSFITSPENSYEVLRVFDVAKLALCVGKPIVAIRNDNTIIVGLKRLPCYDPYEVTR